MTFLSTTVARFRCTEPGAATYVDLVADEIAEVELNGAALDPADVFDGTRIRLDGLADDNTLRVRATCRYMHTGEGLHRFVDPVDKSVYLYTQFEVADSRRMFTVFEQPDLKATFAFTVTAPDDWQVVSNQPTPEPEPAGFGNATWRFAPTAAHLVLHHGAGRRALPPGRRRVPRRRPGHPAGAVLPGLAGRRTSTPT